MVAGANCTRLLLLLLIVVQGGILSYWTTTVGAGAHPQKKTLPVL